MDATLPDVRTIASDLRPPAMTEGRASAGQRVRQALSEYRGTQVYHVLYLPRDWKAGGRYPVLVEYAGNGGYRNAYGDVCTGRPEDSHLGYGISGGKGCIWVCMPFVNSGEKRNELIWWGDVRATVDYCKKTVPWVCREYGGDPSAVILMGFSRGAIACNYIGLHDDDIASLWRGFVAHSHYDGVKQWGYAEGDRASAIRRLMRLKGRPVFISHEGAVDDVRRHLLESGVAAPFTFQVLPYRNHCDDWVLRDLPERRVLRDWLKRVLE